jgi:hypothetical protein
VSATPIDKTLVVLGDFNSSPDDPLIPDPDLALLPPYAQFIAAGYTDAWTLRPGNRPGATCCQDADLRNKKSALDQRIDIIFSREMPTRVKRARVLGATPFSKTRPPGPRLWPSDHGAVAAKLQFFEKHFPWKHEDDLEYDED